MMTFDTLYV